MSLAATIRILGLVLAGLLARTAWAQPATASASRAAVPQTTAPVSLPPMNLEQVVGAVLRADPQIRSGLENVALARSNLTLAGTRPNPVLSSSKVLMPLGRGFTPDHQGGPPELDVFVSWPIDQELFGKRRAAMRAASLEVDVSTAEQADLVRRRLTEATDAFYDALEAQALHAYAKADVEQMRVLVDRYRARAHDNDSALEYDRAQLELTQAQREVIHRASAQVTSRSKLRALMGRTDATEQFELIGSLEVASPSKPMALDAAIRMADQRRPDLIAQRRRVERAKADLARERSFRYPAVIPRAGYQKQYQQSLGMADVSAYGVGVDVSLPLFDRNQAGIERARAALRQLTHDLEARILAARAEDEQAARDYQEAYALLTELDAKQVDRARSVRDRMWTEHGKGKKSLLDVLDAERAFRDARQQYISGRAGYWRSTYRLRAALGAQGER